MKINKCGICVDKYSGVGADGVIIVIGTGLLEATGIKLTPTLSSEGVVTWTCEGSPTKFMSSSCK